MNRRALLMAAPAVALAASAAPAVAAEPVETPVLTAYREWEARRQWLERPEMGLIADAEFNALCCAHDAMLERLIALPCRGVADAAAKMLAVTLSGAYGLDDTATGRRFLEEARTLVAA